MPTSSDDVPVVVLAGFLGAGKTTVLNHLLRSATDVRLGVVVNDFGAVGVDALLVAGWAEAAVTLENGCLCCATDDGTVAELLTRLTAGGRTDAVVVEASGVADPAAMVREVLTCGVAGTTYGGLVLVVDAVEFEATRLRHPVLDSHVAMADVVVLTKTDAADAATTARVADRVRELNRWAPLVPAVHGRLDPRLLLEERPPVQRQLALGEAVPDDHDHDDHGHGHDREHLHVGFESVAFTSPHPLDPRALVRFLEGRPSGVFRAKGVLRFAVAGHDRHRFTVHAVGAALRFTRDRWPRGDDRSTRLVLVGVGLDRDALLDGLRACVHEGPVLDDEMALMGVLRSTDGA